MKIRIQLVDDSGRVVEDLLTMEQASARLGLTRSRIRQLVMAGTLTDYPLDGRSYAVSSRQVEAYARVNRKPGPKATIG